LAVLQARVEARRGDASDATQAVLNRLAAADPGAGDWIAIDTNAPDVVQRIAAAIRNFGISC
jgi:predicted kinase